MERQRREMYIHSHNRVWRSQESRVKRNASKTKYRNSLGISDKLFRFSRKTYRQLKGNIAFLRLRARRMLRKCFAIQNSAASLSFFSPSLAPPPTFYRRSSRNARGNFIRATHIFPPVLQKKKKKELRFFSPPPTKKRFLVNKRWPKGVSFRSQNSYYRIIVVYKVKMAAVPQ